MQGLIHFMRGNMGRTIRLVLGLVLIVAGLVAGGILGAALVLIGLVPVAMGVWGPCLLGFVFRGSTSA